MKPERHQDDVVIVSACRTAFGKFGGVLRNTPALDLAAEVIQGVIRRSGREDVSVDEVIVGCCAQCEVKAMAPVAARQASLRAGLPDEVVSITVERACCSSLAAVQIGQRNIQTGNADVVLVAGMENMSRVPYLVRELRWGTRVGNVALKDDLFEMESAPGYGAVSVDAGEVALEYGFSREDQDRWAYESQMRYQAALKDGKFEEEIIPITIPQARGAPVVFEHDEFPKPQTTVEGLAKLPTIYGSPTVTAGNAPGLDAGAAALLLMRRSRAEAYGLKSLARVLTVQSAAGDPHYMAAVPAKAIQRALACTRLSVDDLSLIEINEAFAAMPMVSLKILADRDEQKTRKLFEITNVNGGAIAIGHPVGASGARVLLTLMFELRRRGGGFGAASLCGGLAQGDAAIIQAE
ncbi:MAG: thiolase family protein [bacterium]